MVASRGGSVALGRRRPSWRGAGFAALLVMIAGLGWIVPWCAASQSERATDDRFEPFRRRMSATLRDHLSGRSYAAWVRHREWQVDDPLRARTTRSLAMLEAGVERVAVTRAFHIVLLEGLPEDRDESSELADSGSGVLAIEPGIVVTAAHVAGPRGRRMQVGFLDGTSREGVSLGGLSDEFIDLGVVRFEPEDDDPQPLRLATAGNAVPEPGEWVVSLGFAPLPGDEHELTVRCRAGRVLRRMGPTAIVDATFAPGDSGGPVYALDGTLIGIATGVARGNPGVNAMQAGDLLRSLAATIIATGGNVDSSARWSTLILEDQHRVLPTEAFVAEHPEARAAVATAAIGVFEVLGVQRVGDGPDRTERRTRLSLATQVGRRTVLAKASSLGAQLGAATLLLRDGAGWEARAAIRSSDEATDLVLLDADRDLPGRPLGQAAIHDPCPLPGMILLCPGPSVPHAGGAIEAAGISEGTYFDTGLSAAPWQGGRIPDDVPTSGRRTGFGRVIVCDADLPPDACGGPLIDLDGEPLGVVIARFDRSATIALPLTTLVEAVRRMGGAR